MFEVIISSDALWKLFLLVISCCCDKLDERGIFGVRYGTVVSLPGVRGPLCFE